MVLFSPFFLFSPLSFFSAAVKVGREKRRKEKESPKPEEIYIQKRAFLEEKEGKRKSGLGIKRRKNPKTL